ACVKPAASVHPEPGSNSSSYILILYFDAFPIGSFSNLATLLLLFFCPHLSIRTAVNSICLRT
ncbi:hypothetical protein, partial [Flavobacterium sp. DG2-3]|uniref:hypothetical protein n=1 Tax=Flavobacterium sp. DG2-3 TaxID=3068317 RepID=UPI00273D137E